MPSRIALIWALAAGATAVAAGAAATYWAHPGFLWPDSAPVVVSARTSEPAPAGLASATAAKPDAEVSAPKSAPASAAPAQTSPEVAAAEGEAPRAALPSEPGAGAAAPTADAPQESGKPAFDIVNVAPTGETVVAGRASPNAKVELRDSGRTVAEATADAQGQFVMVPAALPPGEHSLSLATGAGKSALETSKAVSVSVPAPEAKTAVATATPTEKAASPAATPLTIPVPAAAARVAIQSVEALAGGGLAAKGAADADSTVRLSVNGANIADAKTKSDGRWSLTVQHGMSPGAYVIRAEETRPADATVVASAETRFDYPAARAAEGAPAPVNRVTAPQSSGPLSADVVLDSIQTAQVVPGHTLWALSQNYYGDPTRYPLIYEANKAQIRNPNLIYPGQVFVVPKFEPKP